MKPIYNYAVNVDKKTLEQFEHCYTQDFVKKAALMPDAHQGYVAPIGAVLATEGYVVPAWVGYDIGCGVLSAQMKGITKTEVEEHAKKIYAEVKKRIPMGLGNIHKTKAGVSKGTQKEFEILLKKFKEGPHDKKIFDYLQSTGIRHLGTLGHGNHFIELGIDTRERVWVTIHSGSRGIGHYVATKYMKKSAGAVEKYEETYPLQITSELGKEYLNILEYGLAYALLNRKELLTQVIASIEKVLGTTLSYTIWANTNHNHAVIEHGLLVHRKGATPAPKKGRGVIPANMRDGCYLVEGKGNTNYLSSASHGAGRLVGRAEAKKTITMKDFKTSMKGIKGTVNEETLDEAPQAYKDISEVMEAQSASVTVVGYLRPLINWKGMGRKGGQNTRKV